VPLRAERDMLRGRVVTTADVIRASMIGPGAHEAAAGNAVTEGQAGAGRVYALLAIASAINRLAAVLENRG
jgi:hypothetical protein